jgi:hypothetical protein
VTAVALSWHPSEIRTSSLHLSGSFVSLTNHEAKTKIVRRRYVLLDDLVSAVAVAVAAGAVAAAAVFFVSMISEDFFPLS